MKNEIHLFMVILCTLELFIAYRLGLANPDGHGLLHVGFLFLSLFFLLIVIWIAIVKRKQGHFWIYIFPMLLTIASIELIK